MRRHDFSTLALSLPYYGIPFFSCNSACVISCRQLDFYFIIQCSLKSLESDVQEDRFHYIVIGSCTGDIINSVTIINTT